MRQKYLPAFPNRTAAQDRLSYRLFVLANLPNRLASDLSQNHPASQGQFASLRSFSEARQSSALRPLWRWYLQGRMISGQEFL